MEELCLNHFMKDLVNQSEFNALRDTNDLKGTIAATVQVDKWEKNLYRRYILNICPTLLPIPSS